MAAEHRLHQISAASHLMIITDPSPALQRLAQLYNPRHERREGMLAAVLLKPPRFRLGAGLLPYKLVVSVAKVFTR